MGYASVATASLMDDVLTDNACVRHAYKGMS